MINNTKTTNHGGKEYNVPIIVVWILVKKPYKITILISTYIKKKMTVTIYDLMS